MIVAFYPHPSELSLMFSLMDRIPSGVDPMLADLEVYIIHNGLDDMKACADIITTVSDPTYYGGLG